MRGRLTVCAAVALVSALATAAPAFARATGRTTLATFAGYEATGSYRSVSATFTVPAQHCSGVEARGASIGVGLGTPGPNADRIGIAVTCINGHPADYSYSVFPSPFGGGGGFSAPAHAGDVVEVSMAISHGAVSFDISDQTAGWEVGGGAGPVTANGTAEIGVQHTFLHGVLLPLVDFGSAHFSAAHIGAKPLGSVANTRVTMASGGVVEAAPSALSGGSAFTVAWRHS